MLPHKIIFFFWSLCLSLGTLTKVSRSRDKQKLEHAIGKFIHDIAVLKWTAHRCNMKQSFKILELRVF